MQTITRIPLLRRVIVQAKTKRKTIGFVPTMGFLHEGHLSLIRCSKKENDLTVVSIFVNPKQFGPGEDFKRYPRDKKGDELLVRKEKIDIMFHPTVEEMYPDGFLTYVRVEQMSDVICGQYRPGHFQGVTTVVTKLLNLVSPDILYLGAKDAQQALILKTMVRDLNIPVRVKVLATVRESDGLAMSSRNSYLTNEQRKEAPILYRALQGAREAILSGERDVPKVVKQVKEMIERNSCGRIQYVHCLDARTLNSLSTFKGKVLIALAVWFGSTRLIDNLVVDVP